MTAPLPSILPIVFGTVNGSPIAGYTNAATWQLVFVTLSADYARNPPGGYPVPNPANTNPTPADPNWTFYPRTIPNGTRFQLFADEAQALVTAGAASFS